MAEIIKVGLCTYRDAGTGWSCPKLGKRLTLIDPLGRFMMRTLCRDHSDWVQAHLPRPTQVQHSGNK